MGPHREHHYVTNLRQIALRGPEMFHWCLSVKELDIAYGIMILCTIFPNQVTCIILGVERMYSWLGATTFV